ncbi:MAG: aromatic aminobenezylarsenical efflux permease ArsG family transporter [Rickettsiales bacterium]|nr:aromatic aminobenezylarsenical efflux permease ArsG family transporter [Rickettsiales bacterium]
MLILLNSLWLGILTSISPCHFTNNIAAISYLSKNVSNPKKALLLGAMYTFGRMFLYTTLGMILSFSMSKIGLTSLFLQKQLNIVLGIVLIVIGLIILNIIKFNIHLTPCCGINQEKYKQCSYWGSFLLGILFASAFCPVSAGLFFGNLIQNRGNLFSFLVYGFGTGLPVLTISFILVFATNKIGGFYKKIGIIEKYSTKITGIIFVGTGVCLLFNFIGY